MDINKGDIVLSTAGRDKGNIFYVVDVADSSYVYIADGIIRKIDRPKRKKIKHLKLLSNEDTRIRQKLLANEKVYDAELRKSVRQLNFSFTQEE